MDEIKELRERIDELEDELLNAEDSESENETIHGFVYKLYHIDQPNTFYIGSTTKRLSRRLVEHRSEARKTRSKSKVYRFMREQGADSFTIEPLEEVDVENQEQLRLIEQRYIEQLNPLLNDNRAHITAEQTREQIRIYNQARREHIRAWGLANANKHRCSCGYHTHNKANLRSHLRSYPEHTQQ